MKRISFFVVWMILLASCEKEVKKDPVKINSEITDVSVFGASDGAIEITVTGGREPYSYNWSGGQTTKDLTNIPAGTYTLVVTDNDGDTASLKNTVHSPAELTVDYNVINVTHPDSANGSIALDIRGGVVPYSISWLHGESADSVGRLAAGTYTVTVTDGNGAEKVVEIVLTGPLTLSCSATDVSEYNGQNGTINLNIKGGKEPYTILWNDENNSENRSGLKAGYYTVNVTDGSGASKNSGITVYEPYKTASDLYALANSITRLQQSGLRIETGDKIIYIDPINLFNGTTHDADILMITHSHGDHYNTGVITNLTKGSTKILAPADIYANISTIAASGNAYKVAPDSVVIIDGITIEAVPAYNSNHTLPNSVGYILTIDGKRIYHSGDTKKIPEMASFNVDIACIPMGQTYTFASVSEAAQAARDLSAGLLIPVHYGYAEGTYFDPWTIKELLNGEIDVFVKPVN